MAHGTDKRTDAGLRNEKDGGGGGKKEGRKKGRGRNGRGMKRERENEQKHIREYGRADELPPGRFHRSRCYPRRMTVRERGRERAKGRRGVSGSWREEKGEGRGGGYGGGKDDGRSALRKRITLCGPTKTNRARGSDPLHPPREPPPPPSSYFVARCISK